MPDPLEFVTETGCTIRVVPPPDHWERQDSCQLILAMEQEGDKRWVSVILTQEEMADLRRMLGYARPVMRRWAEERGRDASE